MSTSGDDSDKDRKDPPPKIMAELNRRTGIVSSIRRVTAEVLADAYAGDSFVLQQASTTLQSHFDRLIPVHDTLVAQSMDEAEINTHMELFNQTEDLFNQTMVKLQRMAIAAEPEHGDDGDASVHTQRPMAMNLKLDPLSVPKFDGTLRNWLAFKDAFETLVHKQDYPEAYKLGKLRESVQGDAVALVGGMYSGGYTEVWRTLTDRYDSPKQLADIHVSRFIGLKQESKETTSTLLAIVDTVRESLRALRVMELPVDQWDALAVPIVTSKLPQSTQQAWGMSRTTNEIPTLDELLTFVEKRAHSLAPDVLRWPSSTTPAASSSRKSGNAPAHSQRLIKSNLAATTSGGCPLCSGEEHAIARCARFLAMSPIERFGKLKRSDYCFNCLRRGHASNSCGASLCRNCNGKHHTLLCRGSPPSTVVVSSGGTGTPAASAPSVASNSSPAAPSPGQPPRNHT